METVEIHDGIRTTWKVTSNCCVITKMEKILPASRKRGFTNNKARKGKRS